MLASIREVFPINGMDQNWSKDKTIARIGDLDAPAPKNAAFVFPHSERM